MDNTNALYQTLTLNLKVCLVMDLESTKLTTDTTSEAISVHEVVQPGRAADMPSTILRNVDLPVLESPI